MRLRLLSFALVLGLLSTVTAAPLAASAAAPTSTNPLTSIPVSGNFPAGTTTGGVPTTGGTFSGVLNITSFAVQNGQLVANGLLSGTLTDTATSTVIGTVSNVPVAIPVQATGTCQILNLTLGPLDLNLLGLMVHLNRVHLTITAQQGPGNLLGNLLCAIAHLLDSSASGTALNQLVTLLNHLLASL
jgi:hypothetical protein